MTQAFNLSQLANKVNSSGQLDGATGLTGTITSSALSITGTSYLASSSGNVGIGTTTPGYKLSVNSSNGINSYDGVAGKGRFVLGDPADPNGYVGIYRSAIATIGTAGNDITIASLSGIGFTTGGSTFSTQTERMRIATNGYVGIGTTNTSNPLAVRNSVNNVELGLFENTIASGNVRGVLSAFGNNGNNTSSFHYAGLTQGVSFWYLYGNGTSSWTSDERKKKNIETTRDGYIDDLCKLRVVKYNWKTDEDDKPKELGLIAQEVEQVFPGLIQDALHEDNDGVKYKTIKGSVLPYMLLKAIQEQQTIINDLKARIETLESK